MAWVTAIGPSMEQVDYRLTGGSGCADGTDAAKIAAALGLTLPGTPTGSPGVLHGEQDSAVDYRLTGAERPLRWWGKGLREFGIEPGTWFTEADYDRARRLMDWRDPNTGARLVEPKMAIDPSAMLSATPLLHAIRTRMALADRRNDGLSGAELDTYLTRYAERLDAAAAARLGSKRARERYGTITRQVARRGELHTVPAHELGNLADVFGIDVTELYGQGYETALRTGYELREQQSQGRTVRRLLPKRIVVGNRGFDYTVTLPKSHSVLMAYADQDFATEYERVLDGVVHEGAALLEAWCAYAMRGHHGGRDRDGNAVSAERTAASGSLVG